MIGTGRKYMIDAFFQLGMDRIEKEFPEELTEFRKASTVYNHIEPDARLHIDVLNLLEELGPDHARPSLYYIVAAEEDIDVTTKGQERDNGSIAMLSPQGKTIALAGHIQLLSFQNQYVHHMVEKIKRGMHEKGHLQILSRIRKTSPIRI